MKIAKSKFKEAQTCKYQFFLPAGYLFLPGNSVFAHFRLTHVEVKPCKNGWFEGLVVDRV